MAEQNDTNMGGVSPQSPAQTTDSKTINAMSDAEERAPKRIKVDGPAPDEKENGTKKDNQENELRGENANGPPKPEHVDGRIKGCAPVKKEYVVSLDLMLYQY